MRINRFGLKFGLILIAQILVLNYLNISQVLMVNILPAMILCLPPKQRTVVTMLISFITGFVVDFFAGGMLGLTSLALVAVAFIRIPVLQLAFGHELFTRSGPISVKFFGLRKIIIGIFIVTLVFTVIYVWADGAGTRPFWANFIKVVFSTIANTAIAIPVVNLLTDVKK